MHFCVFEILCRLKLMQSIETSSRTVEQQAGKKEKRSKTDAKRREGQKGGSRKAASCMHARSLRKWNREGIMAALEWSAGDVE